MGLHFQITVEAGHWRVLRAAGSVVMAGALVWAGMMGLDAMKARAVAVYRPQFVGWVQEFSTTCGGCSGCRVSALIQRNPTPPVMRPLGLAAKGSGSEVFLPVVFPEASTAVVNFDEGNDFAGGWDEGVSGGSSD